MSDAADPPGDTRSRIVDVAARLLRELGPLGVTTRGVAERAGVQAPAIYRLFGDKDGLLDAVAEHVMAAHVSAKAEIVQAASAEDADPLDDLRIGWDMQIDFGLSNPTLFALLSDPGRGSRSPAALAGRRVLESRVHRVAVSGRLRVSEKNAVDLIHAAGTGAVLATLSMPLEHRDHRLAGRMYEAVLGQIVTVGPERMKGGAMATTVAFRAIASDLDVLTDAERQLLAEWLDRVIDAG